MSYWPFASCEDILELEEELLHARHVAGVYIWASMREFGRPDMVHCVSLKAAANAFPGAFRWVPS